MLVLHATYASAVGPSHTTQARTVLSVGEASPGRLPENWLGRFNYYRNAAGLPAVTEGVSYSEDLAKHVHYMLLNVPDEGLWHGETSDRPGYTPEGAQAAAESNLWFSGPDFTPVDAIDGWMASVRHRYGMLHHDLVTTGFAIGCDSQHCATGMNVIRGLTPGANPTPEGVVYPGMGQWGVMPGVVISWQFAWQPTAALDSASLLDSDGRSIAITSQSPQPGDYFNIVTVTPSESLSPDGTYTVEIRVSLGSRQLYRTWTFSTSVGFAGYLPLVVVG